MSGANGVAVRPILKLSLGETVPERRPVELEFDGEAVVLQGFVGNRRCPLDVRAEVDAAWKVWAAATGAGTKAYEFNAVSWSRYCRDAMLAIVPGLDYRHAEIIAGDGELVTSLLRYLEWWQEPEEGEADPEVQGEAEEKPTGAKSSPTSPPSTDLVTASS
jgi:hypothetical protein